MTTQTLILLLGLSCVPAAAQAAKAEDNPPTLTVCDILSQPLRYDGKLVRIRSWLKATDEGTWFTSDECPGILTTGKHIWPSIIWFSTPSMPTPNRLHPIDFQLDSESEDRVEAKYRALKGRTPDRCIVWTYTGLFETRRNWSDAQAIDVNGDPLGFGHLGKAPGQLIAKSADDVAVIPNCTAGKGRKKR
jgi:hypothetical protein